MLVVTISSHREKNRPPLPDKLPAGVCGIVVLMIPGLPLATLLSLIACASARRHSVKVWLDPGLHAARRASQWPASIQGVQNRADMLDLLMIAVLVSTFLTTMVIEIGLFPLQGLPPAFVIALMGTTFGSGWVLLWPLLRWTSQTWARLPYECWGHDAHPMTAPLATPNTQSAREEAPDDSDDRLGRDD